MTKKDTALNFSFIPSLDVTSNSMYYIEFVECVHKIVYNYTDLKAKDEIFCTEHLQHSDKVYAKPCCCCLMCCCCLIGLNFTLR